VRRKPVTVSEPRKPTAAELACCARFTLDWPAPKWVVQDSMGTTFHGQTPAEATELAKQYHRKKP
jgi:hypothetical protein